jgi:hypothetical protein
MLPTPGQNFRPNQPDLLGKKFGRWQNLLLVANVIVMSNILPPVLCKFLDQKLKKLKITFLQI